MAATTTLHGRAALVTGGSAGLGLGCAHRLAADGATVTICGRTAEQLEHAAVALARSGGGAIVALSSIAAHLPHRHLSAYTVSKAGLEMLVRNAADELGSVGVRVNAVRPGLVPTSGSSILADHAATVDDYLAQMPLGRLGEVEDVAAAVRFLAGDEASWLTGETINVDGGHHLRRGPDLDGLFGPLFADALQETLGADEEA